MKTLCLILAMALLPALAAAEQEAPRAVADDYAAVPAPGGPQGLLIQSFEVKKVDAEGPWLWWQLAQGFQGRAVIVRAEAGTEVPKEIALERLEVGPVPGHSDWTVVAVLAPNHRGFRDASAKPGKYSYAMAAMARAEVGEAGYVWRSSAMSGAARAELQRPLTAPSEVKATPEANDNGTHLTVTWKVESQEGVAFVVLRSSKDDKPPLQKGTSWTGDWKAAHGEPLTGETREFKDTVEEPGPWRYVVTAVRVGDDGGLGQVAVSTMSAPESARTDWFNETRWVTLAFILLMALALFYYIPKVRKDPEGVFIRRIPGVDAIEDAVGRSTEMGRPVLYVTGVENIQNIQTIASLLCLGPVAEMTAEYDTELKVANFEALTMVVAEEIVKQGYSNAGRADAHRPENCLFISSEQFAFAAGVNGIILRDKPATNIYLGRFFAESLILAETGYVTKSIQIAGTAEVTQLPFFIAACDYTIIGEELYAVSAYLSRDPKLLATLKATDVVKLTVIIVVVVGALLATFGITGVEELLGVTR